MSCRFVWPVAEQVPVETGAVSSWERTSAAGVYKYARQFQVVVTEEIAEQVCTAHVEVEISSRPPGEDEATGRVRVSLARLLLLRKGEAITSFVTDGECSGIAVSISVDEDFLPRDLAESLKPLVLTLHSAKNLPDAAGRPSALLHAFDLPPIAIPAFSQLVSGSKKSKCFHRSSTMSMLSHATQERRLSKVSWEWSVAFFPGKVVPGGLHGVREWLQTHSFSVEVFDREEFTYSPDASNSVIPAHGRTEFRADDLLHKNVMALPKVRGELVPIRSTAKQLRKEVGGDFSPDKILNEPLPSTREIAPDYLQAGSYVTVSFELATPLATDSPDGQPETSDVPAEGDAFKIAPPLPPSSASSDSESGQPYEKYGRMVLVLSYRKTTPVKKLLHFLADHNSRVIGMSSSAPSRALANVQLTEQQRKDSNLDVLTGFCLLDRVRRIVVIEGLRGEGKGLARLVASIDRARANSHRFKLLHHPEVGFSKRLYSSFDLTLRQVKLRTSLDKLLAKPDLYDAAQTDSKVTDVLNKLIEIDCAVCLQTLKQRNLFPSVADMVLIQTLYGDFLSENELTGGCGNSTKSRKTLREQSANANANARKQTLVFGRHAFSALKQKTDTSSLWSRTSRTQTPTHQQQQEEDPDSSSDDSSVLDLPEVACHNVLHKCDMSLKDMFSFHV